MPHLSRLFIRFALVYLIVGFILGGLLLTAKAGLVDQRVWGWLLPHADIMLVGWLVQLAMGVSFWILPRMRRDYRGHIVLAWISFFLLNGGLIVGSGLTLGSVWFPGNWMMMVYVSGLVTQGLAVCLFVVYAWPRILPTITGADVQRQRQAQQAKLQRNRQRGSPPVTRQ